MREHRQAELKSPVPSPDRASTSSQNYQVQGSQTSRQVNRVAEVADVFEDDLDMYQRAEEGKAVKTKNYDCEWKYFLKFLKNNYHKWNVKESDIVKNKVSSEGLDYLLANYISNRHNITAQKKHGIIVRLDPNTIGPVVSKLSSTIERLTDYR